MTTAYHIAKTEQPFTQYPSLMNLQSTNGVDVGSRYGTDQACRRFIEVIYDDIWEPCLKQIKAAPFISVLADAATDVSVRDLEGIYIRLMRDGQPKNVFVAVEELKHATAPGHCNAIDSALQKSGLHDWKMRTVGFGSDGAAVMVGRHGGVSTLLRQEIPYLINIQCLGHGLELAAMDTINQHANMKKVTDLLQGLHKQYHYSPKAWRELCELAEVLQIKIWKPTNLGGTRWLPHIAKALNTLMKDYIPVLTHMENTLETRSASADMLGRARQCIQILKDYKNLLFVALVQDILHVLSCLSLKLQEDGVTLPSALHAFETALLSLTSMATSPGEVLERFLEDTEDGQFHSVPLLNFSQESRDRFHRMKMELLNKVHESLLRRFKNVETDEVLKAASNLADPREWPTDKQDLAHYGSDFLHTVMSHFAEVLDRNGCDRIKAKHSEWPAAKELIKSLPPGQQARAWEDFLLDPDRNKSFSNLLMVVEVILVLPLSTAACERGFSAMKRIKSDWRSQLSVKMLSKLMFLAIEGPPVQDFNSDRALHRWFTSSERARRV